MKNTTPMFPRFHLQTLRQKPQFAQQKLAKGMALLKQKPAKQIGEFFERLSPVRFSSLSKRGKQQSGLEILG